MKNMSFIFFAACVIGACNNKEQTPSVNVKERTLLLKQTADMLYNQSKYEDATRYLDSLIAIDSLNGEYYFKRGYCNAMQFYYYKSTKDYSMAASLNYRKASAYFNMGLNYSLVSDSMAIVYFEKCYKADSTQVQAKEKIRELRSNTTPLGNQKPGIIEDSVLFESI